MALKYISGQFLNGSQWLYERKELETWYTWKVGKDNHTHQIWWLYYLPFGSYKRIIPFFDNRSQWQLYQKEGAKSAKLSTYREWEESIKDNTFHGSTTYRLGVISGSSPFFRAITLNHDLPNPNSNLDVTVTSTNDPKICFSPNKPRLLSQIGQASPHTHSQ